MTTINKKYTIISNVDTFDHNNWYLCGKCKDLFESSMNTHVLIMYVNNDICIMKYSCRNICFFNITLLDWMYTVYFSFFRLNLQMYLRYNGLLLADNQYTPLEEHINFFKES